MSKKRRELLLRTLAFGLLTGLGGAAAALFMGWTWPALVVGIATAVAGGLWWKKHLKHYFRIKKFDEVLPGQLYRSGQISRHNIERVLRRYRIHTVIDMSALDTDPPCADQMAERVAILELGLESRRFVMAGDGTGPLSCVADAVTRMHDAMNEGRRVLVHCAAGAQRTGHIMSAYLLLVQKADPEAVYHYMERFGWEPEKHTQWPAQLNARMPELAKILLERGVIDSIPAELPQFPSVRPATNPRRGTSAPDLLGLKIQSAA